MTLPPAPRHYRHQVGPEGWKQARREADLARPPLPARTVISTSSGKDFKLGDRG